MPQHRWSKILQRTIGLPYRHTGGISYVNQSSWRQAAFPFVEYCDSKFVRMWERLLAKELFVRDVNLEINQNMSETFLYSVLVHSG